MAEAVVDILEGIQIQIQQRKALFSTMGRANRIFQVTMEVGATGQAGKRIAVGQFADAFLGLALFGDVLHRAQDHPGLVR